MHWGMGLIFEKTEALYTEFNERAEAATGSYSSLSDIFYNTVIMCLCVRIIKRSDQGA